MLSPKIINSDFVLNDFDIISVKSFIPGEAFTLAIRLYQSERDLRYIPVSGSTVNIKFSKTDGTLLTKAASINADDRSLMSVSISSSESTDLIGGTILVELTESGLLSSGMIYGGLQKIVSDTGC